MLRFQCLVGAHRQAIDPLPVGTNHKLNGQQNPHKAVCRNNIITVPSESQEWIPKDAQRNSSGARSFSQTMADEQRGRIRKTLSLCSWCLLQSAHERGCSVRDDWRCEKTCHARLRKRRSSTYFFARKEMKRCKKGVQKQEQGIY